MAKRNSTTRIAPSDIPTEGKYTRYNRETMDYDGFFNGQYLGSRENMNAARDMVNEYVYDLERSGGMFTATELDGGASEDEIEVTHLYHDPNQGNDITDKPVGPLACVDYAYGDTFISFDAEDGGTQVSLFGNDPIDLDRLERTLDNLLVLLADPRVAAAREAAR